MKIKIQNHTLKIKVPDYKYFMSWSNIVMKYLPERKANKKTIITIRFVSEKEITRLNTIFKKNNRATNILSFPSDTNGDIAICPSVVNKEAKKINSEILSYWFHIFAHGFLHLFGFDHKDKKSAETMESLEKRIIFDM